LVSLDLHEHWQNDPATNQVVEYAALAHGARHNQVGRHGIRLQIVQPSCGLLQGLRGAIEIARNDARDPQGLNKDEHVVELGDVLLTKTRLVLLVVQVQGNGHHVKTPEPEAGSGEVLVRALLLEELALDVAPDANHRASMRAASASGRGRRSDELKAGSLDAAADLRTAQGLLVQVGLNEHH
jgi:hypothetical protein